MSSEKDLAAEMYKLNIDTALNNGINLRDRTIQLVGDIDSELFSFFDAAMTILESHSRKGITVKINSMGGAVYDGIAIVSRIRASNCKVTTECYGAAMSAACLILASGHKRRISELSWAMWHEASYEAEGRHSQIKYQTQQTDREEQVWAKAMAKYSLMDESFWLDIGQHKDYYISAEQCLELGLVDEIF